MPRAGFIYAGEKFGFIATDRLVAPIAKIFLFHVCASDSVFTRFKIDTPGVLRSTQIHCPNYLRPGTSLSLAPVLVNHYAYTETITELSSQFAIILCTVEVVRLLFAKWRPALRRPQPQYAVHCAKEHPIRWRFLSGRKNQQGLEQGNIGIG